MSLPSRVLAEFTKRRAPTIRRVAEAASARWTRTETDLAAVLAFVERQHRGMNEILALGTNALSVLFQAEVVLHGRCRFGHADVAQIERVLDRWAVSRIGRLRDFVRFVESLVSYAALAFDAGERPDAVEDPR